MIFCAHGYNWQCPRGCVNVFATLSTGNIVVPQMTAVADPDPIKKMEDDITATFKDEDREFDLRAWRYLRIRYPHQSTNIHEIDREIAFEVRKRTK